MRHNKYSFLGRRRVKKRMEIFLIYSSLILIAIFAVFAYGTRKNGHFERKGVKHIKPSFPFIGNLMSILTRKENFVTSIDKIYKSFPDEGYVGFYEFLNPNIIIKDLNLLSDICKKDFNNFHDHKTYVDGEADPIFGNFLITLKGNKWKDMRSTLSPSFTGNKLKGMYPFIWTCGDQLLNYFLKEMDESKNAKGILEVNIVDALKKYTVDIISTTAFGIESNSLKNSENVLYDHGKEIAHLSVVHVAKFLLYSSFPNIMKFLGISIYRKKNIKYFNDLVHASINYRESNNFSRADIIELLKEAKKKTVTSDESNGSIKNETRKWTDYDLTAQAVLFFLGGFDTTSLTTSCVLYELSKCPEALQRLQDEIDETISTTDNITFDVLNDMKYMDMVLSETLRLWPPVGLVDRTSLNDYIIPSEYNSNNIEYKISKSQCIWIPIYSIQRDPKNFPDPDAFIPERYSDENKATINPMANIPFGAGPRQCIGIRYATIVIKVAIFRLLSKFDVVATDKTPIPMVLDMNSIIVLSKKGYWVGLKERKKT